MQSQMQSQGLALPPEPLAGSLAPRVSTKESYVDPSGNDPETGDSDRCSLYIEANPARLVALRRVYKGSTVVHNTPLFPGQVKLGVEEVKDLDAPVPVATDEVSLVGQTIHTFLAWLIHLVKPLSQQAVVSLAKPPQTPDPGVDDLLYLMTLIIPEFFLRPYQVTWDATMFGVFNPDFPLYIKHKDLSEIAHNGQCLSISVLQLWILHLTETTNTGRWWSSCPRNTWLSSFVHCITRPDNYLKGIINRQFKSDLTRKWALTVDQDGVDDTVYEKYDISKEKWAQFCQTRRDPSWEDVRKKAQTIQKQNTAPHVLSRGGYEYLEQKLLAEKTKKKLEEAAQSGIVDGVIDPSSPVKQHMKWKMARTKKIGEMTTEAAKEITEKIISHFQLTIRIIFFYFVNAMYKCVIFGQDSFEEQAPQGSFIPYGRQDVLTATIGHPEHPGRVRAAGAGVTIKQYFGSAPRTSLLPYEELQLLTQQIRDQLEESITEKGLALPPEPLVGPSDPRVSTKESYVDPLGNNPETGDSDRCGLYIEANPAHLVALGRVYEGSTVVHNTPLLPGQVKVGVEEVKDTDALVPVPTNQVSLVGQTIHTFLAWSTHLVKSLSQQVDVSPAKPLQKPDPEVDDPLYLMTLIIPELFLRPYQVTWDATMFEVFNPDFPFYIKHEDLSEITHGG
ncbi:hypothetical protein GmHk_04G011021 [Glycine max]|nr:hypothetical protein GmHk_04G011021 [Glycine max]